MAVVGSVAIGLAGVAGTLSDTDLTIKTADNYLVSGPGKLHDWTIETNVIPISNLVLGPHAFLSCSECWNISYPVKDNEPFGFHRFVDSRLLQTRNHHFSIHRASRSDIRYRLEKAKCKLERRTTLRTKTTEA